MKIHELKSWPKFFAKVITGEKTFEIRLNDRNFETGDFLFLREFDPENSTYSGRFQYARVTYVLGSVDHCAVSPKALHPDYVILALSLHWSTPLYVLPGQKWVSQLRPEPSSASVGGGGLSQDPYSHEKLVMPCGTEAKNTATLRYHIKECPECAHADPYRTR